MSKVDYFKNAIAITGGIASGKSTVANLIKELGYPVFSADELAREVVKKGQPTLLKIVEAFGSLVLTETKELNRKALRALIIEDREKKEQLESITHPAIHNLLIEKLKLFNNKKNIDYWFYEIPLLFETNQQNKFAKIWTTICGRDTQIERLMKRDRCTLEQAQTMLSYQTDDKIRREFSDIIFDSTKSKAHLKDQVNNACKSLTERQSL